MVISKLRLLNLQSIGSKMPSLGSPRKKTPSYTDTSDKHVQFSEEIHVVPATEELSEEDLKECFQQEQDLANIEKEIMMTAARSYQMSQGGCSGIPFDENNYTIRGIEHVGSPSLLRLQRREQAKLIRVVWAEQTRQRDSSIYPNPDKFREVCRKVTGPPKERALALAQEDEREAKGAPTTKRSSKAVAFVQSIRRLTGATPV
jgi:hypothetical protein